MDVLAQVYLIPVGQFLFTAFSVIDRGAALQIQAESTQISKNPSATSLQ